MIYKINEDIFVLFQNYFNDQFNCIIPNKFEVEKYLKQKDFDYQLIYLEHESLIEKLPNGYYSTKQH